MISVCNKYTDKKVYFEVLNADYEIKILYDAEKRKQIIDIERWDSDSNWRQYINKEDTKCAYCRIYSTTDSQEGITHHDFFFKIDSLKNIHPTLEFEQNSGDYIRIPHYRNIAISDYISKILGEEFNEHHYFAIYKIDQKVYFEFFTFQDYSYRYTECGGWDHYNGKRCIGYTSKLSTEITKNFDLHKYIIHDIKIEDYAEVFNLDIENLNKTYNKIQSYNIKRFHDPNNFYKTIPPFDLEQFYNNIKLIKDDISSLFTSRINDSKSDNIILKFSNYSQYSSVLKMLSNFLISSKISCELSGKTNELFSYCHYH